MFGYSIRSHRSRRGRFKTWARAVYAIARRTSSSPIPDAAVGGCPDVPDAIRRESVEFSGIPRVYIFDVGVLNYRTIDMTASASGIVPPTFYGLRSWWEGDTRNVTRSVSRSVLARPPRFPHTSACIRSRSHALSIKDTCAMKSGRRSRGKPRRGRISQSGGGKRYGAFE